MRGLTPAEQLRALRAAEGNPGLIALAAIDLAYPELAEGAREELRSALAACAVPHWFNPVMLREVLEVDQATADEHWERLTKLNMVESFVARGPDAANVHEASRKALRWHLHTADRAGFSSISARIVSHLDDADDIASRIERIYHLLLINPEVGAHELERATRDWLKDSDARKAEAIDAALEELLAEGFLTDRAELRARMTLAMRRIERGAFSAADDADEFLEAAYSFDDDPFLLADAYVLKAAQLVAELDWPEVWSITLQAGKIWEQAVADNPVDPINRSELAAAHDLASVAAQELGWFDTAIETTEQALALRRQLVTDEPRHVGHRRELAGLFKRAARLSAQIGHGREAYEFYSRSIDVLRELNVEQPDHHDIHYDLISAYIDVADFEADHGAIDVALDRWREATDQLRKLVEIDPSQLVWRSKLGSAWMSMCQIQVLAGDLDAARSAVEEALAIYEEMNTLESNSIYRRMLLGAYRAAGNVAVARDELDAAELAFQKADLLDDAETAD